MTAGAAAFMAAVCALVAVVAIEQKPAAWLAFAGMICFLAAAVEALTPRRFYLDRDGIHFRGAFRWNRWTWEEVQYADAVPSTWFGRYTGAVQLTLASGRAVLLEETRTFGDNHHATAAMAANVINSAINDPQYRAALVGNRDRTH